MERYQSHMSTLQFWYGTTRFTVKRKKVTWRPAIFSGRDRQGNARVTLPHDIMEQKEHTIRWEENIRPNKKLDRCAECMGTGKVYAKSFLGNYYKKLKNGKKTWVQQKCPHCSSEKTQATGICSLTSGKCDGKDQCQAQGGKRFFEKHFGKPKRRRLTVRLARLEDDCHRPSPQRPAQ